jgi:uncharacterized protein (UPF0261 family)
MPTIAVLGTFDTKGPEHAYVAELIRRRGFATLLIDVGTGETPRIQPDLSREQVAKMAGVDLASLMRGRDRGKCVTAMAQAAAVVLLKLQQEGGIHGVISLGGGGGTAIGTAGMRALPLGFPKLMVSTLASGNTAQYVGPKDIMMYPAIVDVQGLNRISRVVLARAAGAICGMVGSMEDALPAEDRPVIVASMFGNTTPCVQHAAKLLEARGYEVLVFAATGTGGRTMESLIESGLVSAVLDITTTEWADELVGGTLTAGPTRLEAAGRAALPTVVVPGCLDMVNFGEPSSVPAKFSERRFYQHNPQVTLMRTTPEEGAALGRILAEKVNAYRGPVTVLIPLGGISMVSAPGQPFHWPEADVALFDAIRQYLSPGIPLIERPENINDPAFAGTCADTLFAQIAGSDAAN